ncbi:AEC family transporter [Vandammella animalimorsus]|uniref:AEC family transporter n=1 Tax=Vandammella animalimorsus TaxID=2029117 RepID=A0A3M6R9R3_9BURK|nr:AEC family transporter [Vandammella animalimorsus]RMX11668.1 AEC family transporter [Vandammella animalimorsus]
MSSILAIIFPVFGLILAGWLCRRLRVLGPAAAAELGRFVVWLALPAMLFLIMAKADWRQLYQPAFTATFALAGLGLFAAVAAVQRWRGRSLADASVDALAAAYPNTGYMGFPLTFLLAGQASLVPTTIATMLVVCVMFGLAILLIEYARLPAGQRQPWLLLPRITWSLLKNPLIAAPLAGALYAATGWPLPASGAQLLQLLAGAASPCALVSLGLFLASPVASTGSATPQALGDRQASALAWQLTAVKLLLLPLLTWALGAWVFQLPATPLLLAVLLAALPTGTGPYMLADLYGRDASVTARTVLFSTIASLATLAALIHWMGPAAEG